MKDFSRSEFEKTVGTTDGLRGFSPANLLPGTSAKTNTSSGSFEKARSGNRRNPRPPSRFLQSRVAYPYAFGRSLPVGPEEAVPVYDVRPLLYYKMGHIPGAVNWPRKDYDRNYEKQATEYSGRERSNTPVVVYCTDFACPDGLAVARLLVERGHTVSVLQGGYDAWKVAADYEYGGWTVTSRRITHRARSYVRLPKCFRHPSSQRLFQRRGCFPYDRSTRRIQKDPRHYFSGHLPLRDRRP